MLKKYFDPEVEQILMMLTGSGEKHMQRYRVASKTTHVKYKLLSDEELEKVSFCFLGHVFICLICALKLFR